MANKTLKIDLEDHKRFKRLALEKDIPMRKLFKNMLGPLEKEANEKKKKELDLFRF